MTKDYDESAGNSTTPIITSTLAPDSVSNVSVSKPMPGRRILSEEERELLERKDQRGKEEILNHFKNAVPPPALNNPLNHNSQPNQTQTPIASQKSDNNKVKTFEKKASEEFALAQEVDSILKKVQNLASNLMAGKKARDAAVAGVTPAPASSLGAAPSPTTPNPFAAAAAIPSLIKK